MSMFTASLERIEHPENHERRQDLQEQALTLAECQGILSKKDVDLIINLDKLQNY